MAAPRPPTTKYTDARAAQPSTYAMSPYDKQGAVSPFLLALLHNKNPGKAVPGKGGPLAKMLAGRPR